MLLKDLTEKELIFEYMDACDNYNYYYKSKKEIEEEMNRRYRTGMLMRGEEDGNNAGA